MFGDQAARNAIRDATLGLVELRGAAQMLAESTKRLAAHRCDEGLEAGAQARVFPGQVFLISFVMLVQPVEVCRQLDGPGEIGGVYKAAVSRREGRHVWRAPVNRHRSTDQGAKSFPET